MRTQKLLESLSNHDGNAEDQRRLNKEIILYSTHEFRGTPKLFTLFIRVKTFRKLNQRNSDTFENKIKKIAVVVHVTTIQYDNFIYKAN